MGTIESAKRFQDLASLESHDMPYRFDTLFSVEGWGSKSLSKKKFKLLKGIDAQLRAMLNEDETVHFISWGVDTSLAEELFLGWWMYYLNRVAFVFTTQRILLVQTSAGSKPLALRSQIQYPSIAKIGRTALGNCKITYRSGKASVFVKVPKKDRKHMRDFIEELRGVTTTMAVEDRDKENLCPYCFAVVEGFPRSCPLCGKPYKSAGKAGWLSLVFPGLGDFYLGHRTFGILEMLGAAMVWLGFCMSVQLEGPMDLLDVMTSGASIFVFMHGVDALVTRHMGRKGLFPGSGEIGGARDMTNEEGCRRLGKAHGLGGRCGCVWMIRSGGAAVEKGGEDGGR